MERVTEGLKPMSFIATTFRQHSEESGKTKQRPLPRQSSGQAETTVRIWGEWDCEWSYIPLGLPVLC